MPPLRPLDLRLVVALLAVALLAVALVVRPTVLPQRPCARGRLCVIVHLARRPDRLGPARELRDLLIGWSHRCVVLDATDGSTWPSLGVEAFVDLSLREPRVRSYLNGGEQGCLESHRRCWAMAREASSASVVFEDDVTLLPEARGLLEDGELEAALALGGGAAVLHLVRTIPNALAGGATGDKQIARSVHRVGSPNYSSCAYALDARSAELLLASRRQLPVDDLMASAEGVRSLAVKPPLVRLLKLGTDT